MDEPTEGLAPVIVEQVTASAHARRRRGHLDPAGRAEPRRRHRGGRARGGDGQWADQPRHGCPRPGSRPRTAAAASGRRTACRRAGAEVIDGLRRAARRRSISGRAPGCRQLRRCADGNCLQRRWSTAEPLGHSGAPCAQAAVERTTAPEARRCSRSRLRNGSAAPPWSWAHSTPRAPNCDSSRDRLRALASGAHGRSLDLGQPVDAPT